MNKRFQAICAALALVGLLAPQRAEAYSVLSHEAIIDSLWDGSIKPLLTLRFPAATPEELQKAHAYCYGGAIIQDAGYYPFGSKFFSDLLHYVRSGDFVLALIHESQNLNEYAFALGAVAHYAADNEGHPMATNRVVPMMYPKLRRKFGRLVNYGDDPLAHIRTEFSFDVSQVARNHYAPEAYHDFIGFEVAEDALKRAFLDTYSIDLSKAFHNLALGIGSYRFSVNSILPTMTKVAWAKNKDEITRSLPGVTRRKFLYNLSRSSYHKEWGSNYEKPGLWARFLGWLIGILPKVGPLKKLQIPAHTPETEKLFMASFNATITRAKDLYLDQRLGKLRMPDENLDVGVPPVAGTYPLSDDAYAKLLGLLAEQRFQGISPELRHNILSYYDDPASPIATKRKPEEWAKLQMELGDLKGFQATK